MARQPLHTEFQKDPENVEPFHSIWSDDTGLNNGGLSDYGYLKGATIVTSVWEVEEGDVTVVSDNTASVVIDGVTFAIDLVATVWLSGGTVDSNAKIKNTITTSDGRTLNRHLIIHVREEIA